MKLDTVLSPGESVKVPITKYLTYTVTNDGWTLKIKATRGPIVVIHNPDGSVSIGSSGPVEDDEV